MRLGTPVGATHVVLYESLLQGVGVEASERAGALTTRSMQEVAETLV
jgi:hypothetical protein